MYNEIKRNGKVILVLESILINSFMIEVIKLKYIFFWKSPDTIHLCLIPIDF